MAQEQTRKEVLDLLARGKIGIDEAVVLLEQVAEASSGNEPDPKVSIEEVVFKVDLDAEEDGSPRKELTIEELPVAAAKANSRKPRWLRVRVTELSSGKSKVVVNVPFGMVRFGLGMAKMFAPEKYNVDWDQIGDMMFDQSDWLLVDVEDAESNEHVQIYVD